MRNCAVVVRSGAAMAAAIVMTADALATEWIFKDARALTVPEIKEFLQTKAAVNVNARGYEYMCGWVELNAQQFTSNSRNGEVWGKFMNNGNAVAIKPIKFYAAVEEEGYNAHALLSYLRQEGLIETDGNNRFTKNVNLGEARNPKCIVMLMPKDDFYEVDDDEPVPFVQ